MQHTLLRQVLITLPVIMMCGCGLLKGETEITVAVPDLPAIDIQNPKRFFNNLRLSPYWYVAKDGNQFVAHARTLAIGKLDDPPFIQASRPPQFLFEPLPATPSKLTIRNEYMGRPNFQELDFFTFKAEIIFQKPEELRPVLRPRLATPGETCSFGKNPVDANTVTRLALKLSEQYDIYLVVTEQGKDTQRKTTREKLPVIFNELQRLLALPKTYRVEECYADFYKTFFDTPAKDHEIKRALDSVMQGRDTFYGYFRVKPDVSYNGINIKISHPVYCPDEGTRKSERLQKAEFLGKPHEEGDRLFFCIEDNAVYLSSKHRKRFGWFSGKETFDGTLEILNDQNKTLLQTTEPFTAWEF